MDLLYERCAGLDVHPRSISACVRVVSQGRTTREVRTFGTSTRELQAMAAWLAEMGCTHVAMESTGVYWKPVWHVLEGKFELVLANAMIVRNIPGRKSDVKDAEWISDLLAHGLLRGSFVPPARVQELRDLTRTRKQLVREVARHTLRIQKTLEDANLKLTEVISDVLGLSGRAILHAIIEGETNPERLVDLASGRLKAPRSTLVDALTGRVTEHHRFMLRMHLQQIQALEQAVRELEARAGAGPFRAAVELLTTMPGISDIAARVIVAEIGDDMSRFPTAGHLVSWAGLCPRLDECGQETHDPRPSWRALAQARTRSVGMGSRQEERLLPLGPVPTPEGAARPQEGSPGRSCLHAHCGVLHAQVRSGVPRPRAAPLRARQTGPGLETPTSAEGARRRGDRQAGRLTPQRAQVSF